MVSSPLHVSSPDRVKYKWLVSLGRSGMHAVVMWLAAFLEAVHAPYAARNKLLALGWRQDVCTEYTFEARLRGVSLAS